MHAQDILPVNRWAIALLIIALLLFWSELIFSALPSLGRINQTAQQLGWTSSGTRTYFTLLAILDGLGGLFVLLVLLGAWGWWLPPGWVTLIWVALGIIGIYALFQFSAAFLLPPSFRLVYIFIGIAYFAIGSGIWLLVHP